MITEYQKQQRKNVKSVAEIVAEKKKLISQVNKSTKKVLIITDKQYQDWKKGKFVLSSGIRFQVVGRKKIHKVK